MFAGVPWPEWVMVKIAVCAPTDSVLSVTLTTMLLPTGSIKGVEKGALAVKEASPVIAREDIKISWVPPEFVIVNVLILS